ncbi:MAG: hypothetical protein WC708_01535 [Lentisphaeria bacterium]|jgi:hypothetical protein
MDDYLKECLSDIGNIPLNDFNTLYCRVCARRTCARSGLNNSTFDIRARDWKKNLFEEPQIAEVGDPRFSNIQSKIFAPGGSAYEIRSNAEMPNLDANALAQREAPKNFISLPIQNQPAPSIQYKEETPPEITETPEPIQEVPAIQTKPSLPQQLTNTDFQQGTVLPGGPAPQQATQGNIYVFGEDDEDDK